MVGRHTFGGQGCDTSFSSLCQRITSAEAVLEITVSEFGTLSNLSMQAFQKQNRYSVKPNFAKVAHLAAGGDVHFNSLHPDVIAKLPDCIQKELPIIFTHRGAIERYKQQYQLFQGQLSTELEYQTPQAAALGGTAILLLQKES